MANELQDFVRRALEQGISRQDIRENLHRAGWQADEVQRALDRYCDWPFPIALPRRRPYLSAQEAFFYLVMFLTLYVSSISLGTLLFQYINHWIPDSLQQVYLLDAARATVRNAIASLIITYPVYLFVAYHINAAIRHDPEKRSSKIRKWLTYLTLFLAAGVIIGDLITLLTNFLSGDLTLRFILKILIVLVIAGGIFGYYLWDLRQEEKN